MKTIVSNAFIFAFCLTGLSVPTLLAQQPQNQADSSTANKNAPLPIGKLIDVGGYRLHINCVGKGSPTVVMAAGLGDYSLDWALVQPKIARSTRVCTYDRAGYAWSDQDPKPRSLQRAVDELHTLLKQAGINPPYVLAGHSWGGNIVRVFAGQFPKEVVGMVLVDSSHEDRLEVINRKQVRVRMLSSDELHALFKAEREAEREQETAKNDPLVATTSKSVVVPPKVPPPYDKLPPRIQELRLWARSKGRVADVSDYQEPLLLVYATRAGRTYPLGDMPLIVLSAGTNYFEDDQGVSAKTFFEDHERLQANLAQLSKNGKQIIARKSGHHIQLDEPNLVINAIKDVVNKARRNRLAS